MKRISSRKTVEGAAFADYIRTEKRFSHRNYDYFGKEGDKAKGYLLPIFLIVFLGILFVKLFSLQVLQGSYYKNLADSNRIKTSIIHAPRGIIVDRNGVALVFNTPGFRQTVNGKTILLSREEAISLLSKGEKNLEVDTLRKYTYKDAFVHVLGYIGQISKEELKLPDFKNYRGGDLIGKMGVEKEYEKKLRGINGKKLVEVDATGKTVRTLGQTDPTPGGNITLTVDAKLQEAAYKALQDVKKGAVIVSNPKGEILAMVSKPSFDPNLFTLGESYKTELSEYNSIDEVLSDSESQPFLNRPISGLYPPGSTYKLITAAAGLENKIIDKSFQVEDTGVIQIGAFSFTTWYYTQYGKTEGTLDVIKAIKRSNDIFFYKLAEKIGVKKLSEFAKKLGLGKPLGIDLPGEASGIVPTNEWKKKVIGEQWYLGDTYHYGIGQGYLLVTPLQVNVWTQAIANGGELYQPRLLKNQRSRQGRGSPEAAKINSALQNQNLISDKTSDLIRQGMVESCSPGGVAWPLFKFKVQNAKIKADGKNFLEAPQATTSANFKDYKQIVVACKTGTAQHGGEETLPHAWITLFAPAFDPQIIVTVLVESSGEGSNIAAPIAKKILEEWFSR